MGLSFLYISQQVETYCGLAIGTTTIFYFSRTPHITLNSVSAQPPNKYRLSFHLVYNVENNVFSLKNMNVFIYKLSMYYDGFSEFEIVGNGFPLVII